MFIPIGFLPGDDHSLVTAVNDTGTLAACGSFHYDENFHRIFSYAARWTPGDGLQALPRLPNVTVANASWYSAVGRDVTSDGSRIAFVAPTEDQTSVGAAISDPDGGNLIAITSLPNGTLMPSVDQLSDDGQTAFGYRLVDGFGQGAIWTASGGVQALTPIGDYTNIAPAGGAISADGTISAGSLFTLDPLHLSIATQEAYRWTTSGGVQGLGFLPGETESYTIGMSSDGSQIFGRSSDSFFLWGQGHGMIDLRAPQPPTDFYSLWNGGGLSADGALTVLAYRDISSGRYPPDVSYILKTDPGYYFDFEEVLNEAGAGSQIDGWRGFHCEGISDDGNTVYGYATDPELHQEGFIAKFSDNYLRNLIAPLPVISAPPTAQGAFGEYFSCEFAASGMPYSFDATGLPSGLELGSGTDVDYRPVKVIHGVPMAVGTFQVTLSATNVVGTTTAPLTLTIATSVDPPRLRNISTRGLILTGDNVLIGGFIIPSGQPKTVILRAIGPSLTNSGVSNALADPVLELHEPDGTVVTNDNWMDSQAAEIEATGIAPQDARESAIVETLDPGAYTLIVSGKNDTTGVGLVEAYDLDQTFGSELANISTRGYVGSSNNVLIGGLIVSDSGTYVVVRALGPSLTSAGVSGALADPTLDIYDANGTVIRSNDDWQDDFSYRDVEEHGLAPTDDRESATYMNLAGGNYTAIVRGKNGNVGVGLVEVYKIE